MPLPAPKKGEDKPTFLSRCMGDSIMLSDFPKQDQRYAVCVSLWETHEEESDDEDEGGEQDG
jgi:hypothetical protein